MKSENVVLHGERAVLIDFGIACMLDDFEKMKKRVGSPGASSATHLGLCAFCVCMCVCCCQVVVVVVV